MSEIYTYDGNDDDDDDAYGVIEYPKEFFYGEEAEMYSIAEDSREGDRSDVTPAAASLAGKDSLSLKPKLGNLQRGDEERGGGDMGIETCMVDDEQTKMSDDQIEYYTFDRLTQRKRCRSVLILVACIALFVTAITMAVTFTQLDRRKSRSRGSMADITSEQEQGSPADNASPAFDSPAAASPTIDLYSATEKYVKEILDNCQGPKTFSDPNTRQGQVFRKLVDEVYAGATPDTTGNLVVQELHGDAYLREKYALDNLYLSSYGDSWTRRDNWFNDQDPCDGWEGIDCPVPRASGSCAVIDLSLSNNNMYGILPQEFCCMPCLENVDMSNNNLGGLEFMCLNEIGTLKSLEFSGNMFGFDPISPPP